MPRHRRVGQIVEPNPTIPANVALTQRLRVIAAVAQDRVAPASDASNALRPARLANEFETFGFVEQARKIHQSVHGSNLG
jgi:hypothetical protein